MESRLFEIEEKLKEHIERSDQKLDKILELLNEKNTNKIEKDEVILGKDEVILGVNFHIYDGWYKVYKSEAKFALYLFEVKNNSLIYCLKRQKMYNVNPDINEFIYESKTLIYDNYEKIFNEKVSGAFELNMKNKSDQKFKLLNYEF